MARWRRKERRAASETTVWGECAGRGDAVGSLEFPTHAGGIQSRGCARAVASGALPGARPPRLRSVELATTASAAPRNHLRAPIALDLARRRSDGTVRLALAWTVSSVQSAAIARAWICLRRPAPPGGSVARYRWTQPAAAVLAAAGIGAPWGARTIRHARARLAGLASRKGSRAANARDRVCAATIVRLHPRLRLRLAVQVDGMVTVRGSVLRRAPESVPGGTSAA